MLGLSVLVTVNTGTEGTKVSGSRVQTERLQVPEYEQRRSSY